MICSVVLLVSAILLQKDIIPDLPWFSAVQSNLYRNWTLNTWQRQAACVDFDPDLIYQPKLGACHFNNVEFKTVLNFTHEGRYTGNKPAGRGIAVLGDSHAMGWGVGDEDTFSAELQRLSRRPVYNLSVSSYGTVRELMRMEKSGLLNKVDTIIVQYCVNDLEENVGFRLNAPLVARKKFSWLTRPRTKSFYNVRMLIDAYWLTVHTPFSSFRELLIPKVPPNFLPHYQPIIDAIRRHEALQTKRIILFYSNAHGGKFLDFPTGKDRQVPNLEFAELSLDPEGYFRIDGHPTAASHKKAGQQLFKVIHP